jgi:hypothetical protein
MKANFTERPAVIEPVGNGTFKYRFNIEESESEDGITFNADEVIFGELSSNSILIAVMNDLYGNGVEQKLQNDYAAAQAGILAESKAEAYLAFLRNRVILKNQIEGDLNNYLKS